MSAQPYYDPEVQAALDNQPSLGVVNADTLEKVRVSRLLRNAEAELSDEVERVDHFVSGVDDHDVRVRVHRRKDAQELSPGLYWTHGGGYVLGNPEQDDFRFDRWCQRFGLVGAAVQYRLAPEHPYPAGLEDSYSGLKWLKENGASIGVDTDRIGIGGPSAGGGMAAALALLVRDRGEFEIDYQLLIYPMIDDTRTTVTANWDVPVWAPESNHFGWSSYLGELFESAAVPAHAAPARESNLEGLPPTFIMVGTLDGFADEDIAYAQRLNHAGVPTELHVYPGAPHGFDGFAASTAVARQARSDINAFLGRMLSPS
ncbi:MAG: alpha/beta hydrolase [Actinomycetota bacterium]|nr:alpha/beta hydrolase [Actinomycetota bacterium]